MSLEICFALVTLEMQAELRLDRDDRNLSRCCWLRERADCPSEVSEADSAERVSPSVPTQPLPFLRPRASREVELIQA